MPLCELFVTALWLDVEFVPECSSIYCFFIKKFWPLKKKSAELTSVLREVVVDLLSCAISLWCCVPVTVEKEMAIHSSVLVWRIPGMGEPGGLSFLGSHRVGHDWSDLAAANSLWCCVPVTVEKEMAIHSSILAWRIPWTEKPGGLQSMGSQKSDTT